MDVGPEKSGLTVLVFDYVGHRYVVRITCNRLYDKCLK